MVGTMVLVLMGCGSAVFAGSIAGTVGAGVGTLGVAMAFGLAVIAMAYTIGGISGCHINPAITLGVTLSGRMPFKEALMYMLFQVIGAFIGSAIIFALVSTGAHDGPTFTGSNSFGEGEMLQAFIAETVFTFIFVLVVLGATDKKHGAGNLAGLAIGLTLILIHIVCIPITGTSVNPARSIDFRTYFHCHRRTINTFGRYFIGTQKRRQPLISDMRASEFDNRAIFAFKRHNIGYGTD